MPLISRLGAASSRGFGQLATQASGKYIEDYFSTYLYTGTGSSQIVPNNIAFEDTAEWTSTRLQYTSNTPRAVKVSSTGNVYITLLSGGVAIAKYSGGSLAWQRSLVNPPVLYNAVLTELALDSSENIYAVGYAYNGTYNQITLVKYNSSGVIQWQRKLNQLDSYGYGVTVDSSNNIYITGICYAGPAYAIVAKYNSSGVLQWQKSLQSSDTYGHGIATDSSGNVYVSVQCSDGTSDVCVLVKLDSSGSTVWSVKLRDGYGTSPRVAVDSSDGIYLYGGIYNASYGSIQRVLAKYNTSGVLQWQRKIYFDPNDNAYAVTTDSSNNVYISGTGYINTKAYAFFAKYNSSGVLQWQRGAAQASGSASYGYGIASNGSDFYVVGSASGAGPFMLKLKADGTTTSGYAQVGLFKGFSTDAAGTATSSSISITNSVSSATEAAASLTDGDGLGTSVSETQPAVTGSAGGLVWIKGRNSASSATGHVLTDTVRGRGSYLASQSTNGERTSPAGYDFASFNANGYMLGSPNQFSLVNGTVNYVSWSWKKAPKFMDIVTYTGNLTARNISHNLGSVPGMIIIHCVSNDGYTWPVYHRSLDVSGFGSKTSYIYLDTTGAAGASSAFWNDTDPTDTVFTVGATAAVNQTGYTYVAYLFAHNAGGFGADGSQNVISCGSFTTDGSGNATVNLGYEPQFLMYKASSTTGNWVIADNMRGFSQSNTFRLFPNLVNAEASSTTVVNPTATGFVGVNGELGVSTTYIYLAIRRGPMRVPTDATKVYSVETNQPASGGLFTNNVLTDFAMLKSKSVSQEWYFFDRLRGNSKCLNPPNGTAEGTEQFLFDQMTGGTGTGFGAGYYVSNVFRRAPGFFDVTCYSGTGATLSVNHNLGVVPELIIFKRRDATSNWPVWRTATGTGTTFGYFNDSGAEADQGVSMLTASPTSSAISVGAWGPINGSGGTYVAYLFASCPGVSKVGTYTGTGATQTISCGFTGGARYVLIKRTDSAGSWWVWDTARGMVSGTDPRLAYNSTAAETNADWVYTTTGGFQIVTSDATVNASGGSYIFLAIA